VPSAAASSRIAQTLVRLQDAAHQPLSQLPVDAVGPARRLDALQAQVVER
jgi:hypothetical protein